MQTVPQNSMAQVPSRLHFTLYRFTTENREREITANVVSCFLVSPLRIQLQSDSNSLVLNSFVQIFNYPLY